MHVLYLDPYFLGDPLFMTGLARDLRARMDAGGDGLVIVHGTGEEGERAVEAMGHEPIREAGALVLSDAEAAGAVERAGRDLNRRLVDTLNEAGVSAVRVVASDRGLVRPDGSIGDASWLTRLAGQRAVPVVLAMQADGMSAPRDLDPAGVSALLAAGSDGGSVLALSTRSAGDAEVIARHVPDTEALRRMELAGATSRVVVRASLRQAGHPDGLVERESGA